MHRIKPCGDTRTCLTKLDSISIPSTLVDRKAFDLWIPHLDLVIIGLLFTGKRICDLVAICGKEDNSRNDWEEMLMFRMESIKELLGDKTSRELDINEDADNSRI